MGNSFSCTKAHAKDVDGEHLLLKNEILLAENDVFEAAFLLNMFHWNPRPPTELPCYDSERHSQDYIERLSKHCGIKKGDEVDAALALKAASTHLKGKYKEAEVLAITRARPKKMWSESSTNVDSRVGLVGDGKCQLSAFKDFLAEEVKWDKVFIHMERTASDCMAGVVGYQFAGEANPCSQFSSHMKMNWGKRLVVSQSCTLQKEQIDVCATFGAAGQGKTEFCRQMSKYLLSCNEYEGIDKVIPIMVSFSQGTTWDSSEKCMHSSIIWRIMKALSPPESDDKISYNWSNLKLSEVLREVRSSAAAHFKVDACRVGIVLLVDELMKVNSDYRGKMLDILAGVQHASLQLNRFTQFIVTSLEIAPVRDVVCTRSKRPMVPVVLPELDSAARDEVFKFVEPFYLDILFKRYYPNAVPDPKSKAWNLTKKEFNVFLRALINVCGRHFRTLESALLVLYEAITQGKSVGERVGNEKILANWIENQRREFLNDKADMVLQKRDGEERYSLNMRQLLRAVSPTVLEGSAFNAAALLFQRVISDRECTVSESDVLINGGMTVQYLLDNGVVFNHGRMQRMGMFSPRISLPFLFTESIVSLFKSVPTVWSDEMTLTKVSQRASEIQLGDVTTTIAIAIARLGLTLSIDRMRGGAGVTAGAQYAFEYAVVDLHYLRHCRRTTSCAIEDLFEGSEVERWENEKDIPLEINVATENTYEILQKEWPSPSVSAMCLRQADVPWRGIGCVVNLWKRGGSVLPLLFTNKLQDTSNNGKTSAKAAFEAHAAVKKNSEGKDVYFESGKYYVVVFTCDQALPEKREPGTIYVPVAAVTSMLDPVGGTCLSNIVEDKGGCVTK